MRSAPLRCAIWVLLIVSVSQASVPARNPSKPPRGTDAPGSYPPPGLPPPPPPGPTDGPNLYLGRLRQRIQQIIPQVAPPAHPPVPADLHNVADALVEALESEYRLCRWSAYVWTEPADQPLGVYHGLSGRYACDVPIPSNECVATLGGAIIERLPLRQNVSIAAAAFFIPRTDPNWFAAFTPVDDPEVQELQNLLGEYSQSFADFVLECLEGRRPPEIDLAQVARCALGLFEASGLVLPRQLMLVYASDPAESQPEGHLISFSLPLTEHGDGFEVTGVLLPPTMQEVHATLAPAAPATLN